MRIPRGGRLDAVLLPLTFAVDLLVFTTFLIGDPEPGPTEQVVLVAGTAAAVAVLLGRRRAPARAFAATWSLAVLGRVFLPGAHSILALLVALTALAQRSPLGVSLAAAAAALVPGALEVAQLLDAGFAVTDEVGALVGLGTNWIVLVGVAWGLGRWLGRNSRQIDVLEAERDRQRVRAEQAVATERARIARELHDIVSNAVTVMVLHAAGARRVLPGDPQRAEQALATIEGAGTQAMGELRRLLGLLRDSGVASAATQAVAGLAQLDDVVRDVRSIGVEVRTEVWGTVESLDPSVDLAAYRVVQEALTNVAKHGGPGTRVRVRLDWTPAWLDVLVDDDGAGTPASGGSLSTGHGLLGLRERLGVVGGSLTSGPSEEGGYHVSARLPVVAEVAAVDPGVAVQA